ncbi:M55 family metallopeptidase [Heliorestis acidaminivorans]|uniref:M55 family metallopeptidase n=1 Tax=Heliorestis acidaminivorans TaxID=553427 RepID=UPI0014783A60|nr:M55 family metallopeptidase [Heliorestis acidaminivorans]
MRLYISADLEGVAAVVSSSQLTEPLEYERARRWMTEEVSAAIRGASSAGVDQIVVNDAHLTMTNLLVDDLPGYVEVISGKPKELGMMAAIDDNFDLAFFIGYHARHGSPGVLSHSYSDAIVGMELNGLEIGELGFNAALAGVFGVPVALVSGDEEVALEGSQLVGTSFVIVKSSVSQQSARTLLPKQSQAMIEQKSYEIIQAWKTGNVHLEAYYLEGPYCLRVIFRSPLMAKIVSFMPGLKQRDPCCVEFYHSDFPTVYRAFQAMLILAGRP